MDNLLKDLLEIGSDINGTLERFMNNEALYIKFLIKFLDDPNMTSLKESLVNADYEKAFVSAHTLKGVTSNLGLSTLYLPMTDLTESLRENRLEHIDEQIDSIYCSYVEICEIIEKYT